jgi:hypothetical protein
MSIRAPKPIGGPLHLRGVILGEEFQPGYTQRLTDAVLRALGATAPRGSGQPGYSN